MDLKATQSCKVTISSRVLLKTLWNTLLSAKSSPKQSHRWIEKTKLWNSVIDLIKKSLMIAAIISLQITALQFRAASMRTTSRSSKRKRIYMLSIMMQMRQALLWRWDPSTIGVGQHPRSLEGRAQSSLLWPSMRMCPSILKCLSLKSYIATSSISNLATSLVRILRRSLNQCQTCRNSRPNSQNHP